MAKSFVASTQGERKNSLNIKYIMTLQQKKTRIQLFSLKMKKIRYVFLLIQANIFKKEQNTTI